MSTDVPLPIRTDSKIQQMQNEMFNHILHIKPIERRTMRKNEMNQTPNYYYYQCK